jgi:Fe2+ or Zn2+ uptake regulation protein
VEKVFVQSETESTCCTRTLREGFARANLRMTKQRGDVYDALAACRCHPTAEHLHRLVSESAPGTSLATVYNTLDALVEAGLCRRIATTTGARYDADMTDHLHVFTPDGTLMDLHPEQGNCRLAALATGLREELERRLGVPVDRLSVQVHIESSGT